METLRARDLRLLFDFVGQVYAFRDVDGLARHLVENLSAVVPCERTSFDEIDPSRRISKYLASPSDDDPANAEAWLTYMHEHPVLEHYLRTRDGRAFKISDFASVRGFQRTAIYNELYRRIGLEDEVDLTFPAPYPLMVGVGLGRSRRNFTERERLLLNLLRPHLAQAYGNALAVMGLERDRSQLLRTLDAAGRGVLGLSTEARVIYANEEARRCIAEYFDTSPRRPRRVPDLLRRWLDHEEAQLSPKNNETPAPREPLVLERNGKRLVVRLVSDATERLLVFEEHDFAGLQPSAFKSLGLTRREAEIVTTLSEGKSNLEIATVLGISARTVQKHLEHIYVKLGVESRTAAVAKALEARGH